MSTHTTETKDSCISPIKENSTNSEPAQRSVKKRKYLKVDYDIRVKLVVKVLFQRKSIRKAAREMGLNFSTGKAIVKIFRDEGRILKKCEQGDFNFTYQIFESSVYRMLKEHEARRGKTKGRTVDATTQETVATILSQLKLLSKPKEKVEVAGTMAQNVNAAFQHHQIQQQVPQFMGIPSFMLPMQTALPQPQFTQPQFNQGFWPLLPGTSATQITNLIVASNTMQQRLQADLETQLMFRSTCAQQQHQQPAAIQQQQPQLPTFQVTAPIVYNPGKCLPQLPSFQSFQSTGFPQFFNQQQQQPRFQPSKSAISFPFSQPLTTGQTGLWTSNNFTGNRQF